MNLLRSKIIQKINNEQSLNIIWSFFDVIMKLIKIEISKISHYRNSSKSLKQKNRLHLIRYNN